MSAWLKPAAAALAALIAFGAGCRYSAAQADAEISALKEDYATRARALERSIVRVKPLQTQSSERHGRSVTSRSLMLATLSADLERVRKQSDAARRRLSATAAGPCKSCEEQLARSTGIIERGAVLLQRCVRLSQRVAIDKDAVVKIADGP